MGSPHQKRRRVTYGAKDTPQMPVLVNPKAIEKHTMLVALDDKTTKRAMDRDRDQKVKAAIQNIYREGQCLRARDT